VLLAKKREFSTRSIERRDKDEVDAQAMDYSYGTAVVDSTELPGLSTSAKTSKARFFIPIRPMRAASIS
jgi:hypothetical protein